MPAKLLCRLINGWGRGDSFDNPGVGMDYRMFLRLARSSRQINIGFRIAKSDYVPSYNSDDYELALLIETDEKFMPIWKMKAQRSTELNISNKKAD